MSALSRKDLIYGGVMAGLTRRVVMAGLTRRIVMAGLTRHKNAMSKYSRQIWSVLVNMISLLLSFA